MESAIHVLPSLNAALNALAAVLLVLGWLQIKTGRQWAHKVTMLSAFGVSMAFLACYLAYHYLLHSYYHSAGVPFKGPPDVRAMYLAMLVSHVVLAALVPLLAGVTIYLGLKDARQKHRQLARWTFPIWLYVSLTGVMIYVMLYHLYPESSQELIITRSAPVARQPADTNQGQTP